MASALLLSLLTSSCALVPAELNLFPLYRHRLDRENALLELDVLWPLVHWERTRTGGSDFRIRPLYRRVAEAEWTEHQFLWPLGRVRVDARETRSRLLPLWWHVTRENDRGQTETDWTVALLAWGGSTDGEHTHLALLPFYADVPGFLGYDRFVTHLFPLHVHLERGDSRAEILLWPLIGWGGDGERRSWHRFLPFYSVNVDRERFERYHVLWPFVHWGTENLGGDDPVRQFAFFPFFGRRVSERTDAWTVAWPLLQKLAVEDRLYQLDAPWPIFRRRVEETTAGRIDQWWVMPFVARTVAPRQRSWVWLWPLVWSRHFEDPEGTQDQLWVLPFFWSVRREREDGTRDAFWKVWPLWHHDRRHDGNADWSVLSPWPWRAGNAYGVEEAYGWLWTLARGRSAPDDSSLDVAGHLFTTRTRRGRTQTSVPFLFSYEDDEDGATLRLLQFLPIPLGGGRTEEAPR